MNKGAAPVLTNKWRTLWLLALAELLAMAVWFSASAVVPQLTVEWQLTANGRAWLTMSVQIGFVIGALSSATLNLADRWPARRFFTISAFAAGMATLLIPFLANGLLPALILRFLTGALLAGVYPVGMKIMATWTRADRGLGIGLLVGALTIGSAAPHLLTLFGGEYNWQIVLIAAGGLALLGGLLAAFFVHEGPYQTRTPPFNWRQVGMILKQREVMLANLGYLGHMWELYAVWAWVPLFLLASFVQSGTAVFWAGLGSFAVIAIGGLGSLWAGQLADRYGRAPVAAGAMLISGSCAAGIGFLFGGNPLLVITVALIWGFTVVADSAQFSAAISELAPSAYMGTALTLQTSLGFLLTLFTIRLIPTLETAVGWRFAFLSLAPGPFLGIAAMIALHRRLATRKAVG